MRVHQTASTRSFKQGSCCGCYRNIDRAAAAAGRREIGPRPAPSTAILTLVTFIDMHASNDLEIITILREITTEIITSVK
jgi:hypothetical protein